MMEVILEKPEQKSASVSMSDSKVRQNYAPFISKCPRFGENKKHKMQQQLESKVLQKLQERVSIKNSSRVIQNQKKPKIYEQYIFKSNKGRFQHDLSTDTPSPGEYQINLEKRLKTLQSSHSRVKLDSILLRQSTLPTIPDKRNKYGINLEDVSFVQKTNDQLKREKKLMKLYRDTLSEQKYSQHAQMRKYYQFQKQLEKRIKAQVTNQTCSQKQNKKSLPRAQSQGRLKVNHLYQYCPNKNSVKLAPIKLEKKPEKKHRLTKYQFFNSSQKRFKENSIDGNTKSKTTVRHYLNHISAPEKH